MADITKAELVAQFPAGDAVGAWWTSASDFPASALPAEFFYRTLKAAYMAQQAKNVGLSAGSQINAYAAPTYGAPTLDLSTGVESALVTNAVRTIVAFNPDVAAAPVI